MNSDLDDLFKLLQERPAHLSGHEKLEWLIGEYFRLQDDNDRLQEENRVLREEVSRLELSRSVPDPGSGASPAVNALSTDALELYEDLPDVLTFADFFAFAADRNSPQPARSYLLAFLQSRMLLREGPRLRKNAHYGMRG
jgi:hypothetical protein